MKNGFLQTFCKRLRVMSLHPEIHFASLFDHCAKETNFQCFQGNHLNRLNLHRKSLKDLLQHEQARFLPFRQLKVLFNQQEKHPTWLKHQDLFDDNHPGKFHRDQCELVILGIGSRFLADRNRDMKTIELQKMAESYLASEPTDDQYIYFAVAIPESNDVQLPGSYVELRMLLPELTVIDASVCGQARALLDWHSSFQYCGKCGAKTESLDGGIRRQCQKCQHKIYPRTDPVTITLVIHPDGQRILLGRKPTFPKQIFSCLAGFMEPGESIEESSSREVWEESGIVIDPKRTRYFQSQPWPFLGGQLMIGCHAHAIDDQVTLHDSELEDCRWFTRDELKDMIERARNLHLDKNDPGLRIPPPVAIAHQMIYHWYSTMATK